MPRLYLAPEGQLSPSGHGYDPDALTWRRSTPIIADGETVGMATLDRSDFNGWTWIVADAVFDEGFDLDVDTAVTLDVEPAMERYEVTQGQPAHWVESGVLRRLVVSETAEFPIVDGQISQRIADAERALVAASDNDEPTGIAVVLTVSEESAEAIRHAEGLDVSELHATLGFFGSVDEADEALRDNLLMWAEATGALYSPVTASVSGRAAMGFDDPQAVALLVENESLESMRSEIDDAERAKAMSRLHPHFTPHVTIGYGVDFDEVTAEGDVAFDEIAVWWGADRVSFPLSGDLTAAAFQADVDGVPVEGVIVVEGTPTGDDRMIEPGALTWDTLPIPILFDRDEGDHTAMTVGRIDTIERRDNGEIWASGRLSESEDTETQAAVLRAAELLEEGAVGVSISLDSESAEIRVSAEAVERIEESIEAQEDGELPEVETDDEGRQIVARWEAGEELYVVTSARIRHVAIVDTPAFAEAKLALVASGGYLRRAIGPTLNLIIDGNTISGGTVIASTSDGITLQAHAAAATMDFDAPPRSWFEMDEPPEDDPRVVWVDGEGAPCDPSDASARPWGVPLTVTVDGQVFGHLASWQDCHTGFEDRCVTPPRSNSGYAWFHTGAVTTEDGSQVATGRITVDTSHAPHRMNAASAVAHYDQTGHAVADVHVTDGEMGPWMSGWVRPWATAQQRHELTAHPPSGDWRPRGGSTELIGVLAVNVAGFPMPRSVATYRAGELASLVASGLPPVAPEPDDYVPAEILDRLSLVEARLEAGDVLRELESV